MSLGSACRRPSALTQMQVEQNSPGERGKVLKHTGSAYSYLLTHISYEHVDTDCSLQVTAVILERLKWLSVSSDERHAQFQ